MSFFGSCVVGDVQITFLFVDKPGPQLLLGFFFNSSQNSQLDVAPWGGNSYVADIYIIFLLWIMCVLQEKEEDGGRGRFKSHTTGAVRIADREKKAPLKQ